jgi:hypothetical protein
MSSATLFRSAWGYNPPGMHIRLFERLFRTFYSLASEIDNFNIYSKDSSAKIECARVANPESLEEIVALVSGRILTNPELYDSSFIGFSRMNLSEPAWLEFRVERPYLTVAAQDSVHLFTSSSSQQAETNATKIIGLAERVASIDDIKEVFGFFQGKTTFFVGEPRLLYRPKLMENFDNRSVPKEVAESFWQMYDVTGHVFPRREILDLLGICSLDFHELEGDRVSARFCRAFDDVEVDAEEIFDDVGELVERALKKKGIEKSWS